MEPLVPIAMVPFVGPMVLTVFYDLILIVFHILNFLNVNFSISLIC